jgi:hypothetical protein
MLIRIIGIIALLLLSIGSANAACGPDTPPAIAVAQGLTCEVFVDNFTDTSSIDTANTLSPASCSGATFPNGVCHWYVNNGWANTAYTNCPGCVGNLNASKNLPATTINDYSISSGLLLHPHQITVTGNTVSGSNQLTNLSSTTGISPLGNAVVFGPGVPWTSSTGTWFTLSGTTATMSANATSTNTGATYTLSNVYNGWMMQTCGYSASAPGWVGTAFTGNMYVQMDATIGTQGPNWSGNESEPEGWTWPEELFTGGPPSSTLLAIMEMDFFDTGGLNQRVIWNEEFISGSVNFLESAGGPGPYYGYTPSLGTSPYGFLVMSPSSNAGGTNVGIVSVDSGGSTYGTLNYGPSIVPTTPVGGALDGSPPTGAFTLLPQQHYCLMLDAAPDWPMTVHSVKVWQAPPSTAGGGRKGLFR